jgi:hypothetical protein
MKFSGQINRYLLLVDIFTDEIYLHVLCMAKKILVQLKISIMKSTNRFDW